jgi:hypothetical protein
VYYSICLQDVTGTGTPTNHIKRVKGSFRAFGCGFRTFCDFLLKIFGWTEVPRLVFSCALAECLVTDIYDRSISDTDAGVADSVQYSTLDSVLDAVLGSVWIQHRTQYRTQYRSEYRSRHEGLFVLTSTANYDDSVLVTPKHFTATETRRL